MKKILLIATCILSLYAVENQEINTRYFGGLSENKVILPKSAIYSAPLIVTEEVFVAKSANDIDKVIEEQKLNDIKDATSAKEFLEDRSGHLYGGLSQSKLKF